MEIKRFPPVDLDSQSYDMLTARFDVEGDLQQQINTLQMKVDALHRRGIPVGEDVLRIIALLKKKSVNSQSAHFLVEALDKGLI